MPVFKAKFPSTCPNCGSKIEPGVEVSWEPGTKAIHTKCPVDASPSTTGKPRFVLAMEAVAGPTSFPSAAVESTKPSPAKPPAVRPEARQYLVALATRYGSRPERAAPDLIPDAQALVLSVGPSGTPAERVVIVRGKELWYVRFNGDAHSDRTVNNVEGGREIAWRVAWSPTVAMAVDALRG